MDELSQARLSQARWNAAEAFARALRTGEPSAARAASQCWTDDVSFRAGGVEIKGRATVLDRLSVQSPMTPALRRGGWAFPEKDGDHAVIHADFSMLGAAPRDYVLKIRFNQADQIVDVEETFQFAMRGELTTSIPQRVRAAIDGALANGTPMVVSYVGEDGLPSISLRGSVQVFSGTALAAWIRNAESGLVKAARRGTGLALLYRDSATRTTLTVRGMGRIAEDAETRRRVFEIIPEVEQTHDLQRKGAALIIDVEKITGTSPQGAVLVEPKAY